MRKIGSGKAGVKDWMICSSEARTDSESRAVLLWRRCGTALGFCEDKTGRNSTGHGDRERYYSHIACLQKTRGRHFTGLEIQEDTAEMARRSVLYNSLEDKIDIVTGDIKEAAEIFRPAFFDVITTNPPYMLARHGLTNSADTKTIARHEVLCSLDDICGRV